MVSALCFHTPPNSDMDCGIFYVRTYYVNTCDCTRALVAPGNRTCVNGVTVRVPVQLLASARTEGTGKNKLGQLAYLEIRRIDSIRQYLFTEAINTPVSSLVPARLDYCNAVVACSPQLLIFQFSPLFSILHCSLCDLPHSRPVHSLMLSSNLFLCLPCLLPLFTVPCKMVLARPDERETWPYHCSLRLFTIVRRSSCGPIACWILARTSSLVTRSLYEMCSILRQHLISKACILL